MAKFDDETATCSCLSLRRERGSGAILIPAVQVGGVTTPAVLSSRARFTSPDILRRQGKSEMSGRPAM